MSPPIVIDRIEGNRVVLVVAGETVELPVSVLPEGASEGDILTLEMGDQRALRTAAEERLSRLSENSTLPDEIDL